MIMTKKKTLNYREKTEAKKAKEYTAICTALKLKTVVKSFGLLKTLWAMKRFIRLQSELSQLTKQKEQLESDMAKIGIEEKRIAMAV